MNQFHASRRLVAAGCSLIFCLAVFLPLTAQVTGHAPQGKLAEATSSPFPEFHWNMRAFTAMGKTLASGWLDKNFPFRGDLIRWYNYSSAKVFGSMSSNSPVVVGKEGWLYLSRDRSLDVLEEHRAVKPLTEDQMAALAAIYEERQAWCAERGIKYLVAVPPNKESVYPELLPDAYAQVGKLSRMDQIMDYLRNNSGLNAVDLRHPIEEAKWDGQVYYATDSHWNARGAFPAYQEIIRRLSKDIPELKPQSASDFFVQEFTFIGGDLSYMVGMEELVTENKVYMLPKGTRKARGVSFGVKKPDYLQPAQASEIEGSRAPRAIFFHDSYFWDLLPLLGEHFSRAVYVWLQPGLSSGQRFFDKELIEAERPDVVVEEVAERFFVQTALKSPPVREQGK